MTTDKVQLLVSTKGEDLVICRCTLENVLPSHALTPTLDLHSWMFTVIYSKQVIVSVGGHSREFTYMVERVLSNTEFITGQ